MLVGASASAGSGAETTSAADANCNTFADMRQKYPIAAEFNGGFFAANMYGNVMQFDHVSGKDYIEFVVRCHWGTMPSNLQAWMVAHRFSKFDELNKNVSGIFICRCACIFLCTW